MTRRPRRCGRSTPGRAGSSCTPGPSSSRSTTRPSASWRRSPPSARCRSSSTPAAESRRSGATSYELAGDFPQARFILAHAGITDLAWIWKVAPDHPNLTFDTSWWLGPDLQALFSLVPPGQIVFASDAPYGDTLIAAVSQLRGMIHAGLSPEQIACVASGQSLRIASREPLAAVGPAVGERERAPHILLERVSSFTMFGAMSMIRGNTDGRGPEMIALARLACLVPDDHDDAPVCAAVDRLLALWEELNEADPEARAPRRLLMLAASIAQTPDVPLPPDALSS